MMAEARVLYAGLHLLDRQLVDREGRLCGKVDDLDLEHDEGTGQLYVSALLSGPGALTYRLNARRLGRWLEWVNGVVSVGGNPDPTLVPFTRVSDIGDHITVAVDHGEVGTASAERWVRDHVIGHIPGSRSGTDATE